MMEMEDILSQVQNPLTDENIINLLNRYKKRLPGPFYTTLVEPENISALGVINKEDQSKFKRVLFSIWKNNILSKSDKEVQTLKEKGIYDENFDKLRAYLQILPSDINSAQIDKLGEHRVFQKYGWKNGPVFQKVYSNRIEGNANEPPKIKHRLYLGINFQDIYYFAALFTYKCQTKNIPYYFKFSTGMPREDTVVIYASDELLPKYIEIIKEIKKEKPSIIERCQKPPILTGKIDDKIGYGAESDTGAESYNESRSVIVESGIKQAITSWCIAHAKDVIIPEKNITVENAAVSFTANKIYERALYWRWPHANFTKEQIQTPEYRAKLIDSCRRFSSEILRQEPFKLEPPFIYIHPYDSEEMEKAILPYIVRKDPTFIEQVRKSIGEKAKEKGLDPQAIMFEPNTRTSSLKKKPQDVRPLPSFDELEKLYREYEVKKNPKTNQSIITKKENGEIITDPIMIHNIVFANFWVNAAQIKQFVNDREGYAFNSGSRMTYEFFWNKVILELKTNDFLDSKELYRNSELLEYKYSSQIIANLFQNPSTIKLIEMLLTDRGQVKEGALAQTEPLYGDIYYASRLASENNVNNKKK